MLSYCVCGAVKAVGVFNSRDNVALIGGTSISGGQTNPLNVVFGGLTVGFVPIAIQAMGLGAQAQSLVYGIFIILVVALTTVRTRETVIK